ncbi:MAG: hypothetical protein WC989_07355 [Micavibrio sp.]
MKIKPPQSSERGGVLVWILIAVALFAALSFAILRDGNSGTATRIMSDAQARLAAIEIVAYGNELKQAVQRLQIRGCSENELDFGNTAWIATTTGEIIQPTGHNPNAPPTGCSIFQPGDGGISARTFPSAFFTTISGAPVNYGVARISKASVPGVGVENNQELLYRLSLVNKEICLKINEILGIENPGGLIPETAGALSLYSGDLGQGAPIADISGKIRGKTAFCASGTERRYYLVLIAR